MTAAKPHMRRERGIWACWSSFGCDFIVGRGRTPREAWMDWHGRRTIARAGKGAQA